MKIIWISAVWSIVAVVLPKSIMHSFSWYDLHYFFLFFALAIPGDIRDAAFDQPKMKTIPQLIGIRNAQILCFLLFSLYLIINVILLKSNIISIIILLLSSLILLHKRIPFRYELMDGLLFAIGIFHLCLKY